MKDEIANHSEPVESDEKIINTTLFPGEYTIQVRDNNGNVLVDWSLTRNLKAGFINVEIKSTIVEKPKDNTGAWGSASCITQPNL